MWDFIYDKNLPTKIGRFSIYEFSRFPCYGKRCCRRNLLAETRSLIACMEILVSLVTADLSEVVIN